MKKTASLFSSMLIIVVLSFESTALAQPIVRVDSFFMPSLGRTKKLSVMLPSGYDPARRYPVLYLLHGYTGGYEDWNSKTKLRDYMKEVPHLKYCEMTDMVLDKEGKVRAELFQADKLHFNDAGNKLMAERVRPFLPKPVK